MEMAGLADNTIDQNMTIWKINLYADQKLQKGTVRRQESSSDIIFLHCHVIA